MKKTNTYWASSKGLRKTLLIMKLSFALMFFCLFQVSATIYSQSTRLSISSTKMTVKEIFEEIEGQSEFKFLYRKDHLDDAVSISLNKKNNTVEDILDNILLHYNNMTYTVLEDNLIVISSKQEDLIIRGQVYSSDNQALPGVNVYIKGIPQAGTITDSEGKYSIAVESKENILVFSFVGYLTEEVIVGSQTTLNISLVPELKVLDEVIVIGYGSMKRSDITGAVSSIKEEDINSVGSSSIDNMLSGKVAGLTVRMNSAQPGGGVEVLVRGAASGAGNEPLYVIDGFPISSSSVEPEGGRYSNGSRSPLSSINPNDIESVEVLKDASATAIYGARAANGVVLITTKRGKEGKLDIQYNVNYSEQRVKNPYELLSKRDFLIERNRYHRDLSYKDYQAYPFGPLDTAIVNVLPYEPLYSQEEIDNADEGTDWFKEVTRKGIIQDHNITVQSGTEKTKFYSSFNYFDQQGILKNIDLTRYAGRLNIDQKLANWIDLGINLSGSNITNNNSQMGGTNDKSGLLSTAYQYPATLPVRDSLGNYPVNPDRPVLPNPVSLLEITDITVTQRYLVRSFLKIKLFEGLYYMPSLGYDSDMGKRSRYTPKSTLFGYNVGGSATISEIRRNSVIFENTLNYSKEFEKFSVDALLGMSYQDFKGEGFSAGNTSFLTDLLLYNDISVGESERPYVDSWKSFDELVSYFGRVHLGYNRKYLLTLTMRVDGSTKFGEQNRYGYFPSGAFAYRIIEEDFLKNLSFLSDLKIRVSYGQTGNSNIGQNAYALLSAGRNYPFNNSVNIGMYQSQIGNQYLQWETNTEFNLGLDFGFFGNRIWGNAEYFNKTISELLDYVDLPSYFPVDKAPDNIGKRQSSGYELTLNSQNLVGRFKWSTDITFGSFKDSWKERNPNVVLNVYETENGPLHSIYGYRTDGLTYPDPDIPLDSLYPQLANPLPGDLNILDLNGMDTINNVLTGIPDGAITDADKVLLGTSLPKWTFGINNRFEYKNFDLNIYIYGMMGLTVYNKTKAEMTKGYMLDYNTNQLEAIKDRYSPYSNPDGKIPIGIRDQYWGSSDYFMEDASFVRIKSITLGYTFHGLFNKKIESIRLYADINNVYVFTKYSGSDPETESNPNTKSGGGDSMASYPFPMTTSFGASVKF